MTKTIGKYLLAIGAVVAVGLGALFFIQYLRDADDPEKQAREYMEALEKAYREDQYGGNTPEETLQLFIDALKKGDTDLAAKYFVVDEQEKWREKLLDIQKKNVLTLMVNDLERLKLTKQNEDRVFFTLANEQKTVLVEMIFVKNINNNWKILEL